MEHTRVNIHKDDTVKIISGRGKNLKEGRRVLAVFPNDGKVLVEGVKVVKKHVRRNPAWPGHKSGVLDRPARGQQQCPRAAHIRLRRDECAHQSRTLAR